MLNIMRNRLIILIGITISLIAMFLALIVENRNEHYLNYLNSKIDHDIAIKSDESIDILFEYINRIESESSEINDLRIKIFINKYKSFAIYNEYKYNIPASITLAQAILESGVGESRLAKEANNFFGVKLHKKHKNGYILVDDDAPKEKFCKYNSIAESFSDHASVLKKDRYKKLFDLDETDYKSWAQGLKSCGYATNKKYPELLINLIEKYNLDKI